MTLSTRFILNCISFDGDLMQIFYRRSYSVSFLKVIKSVKQKKVEDSFQVRLKE